MIAKTEEEIRAFMAEVDGLSPEESQKRVDAWKRAIAELPLEERALALRAARVVLGEKKEQATERRDLGVAVSLMVVRIIAALIDAKIIDKDDALLKKINDASIKQDMDALMTASVEMAAQYGIRF